MNEFDGRKLDHKTLEELRIQAVKRVENGESPEAVIKALGFSRARIYDWLARYREHGIDGLRSRKATGRPPRLNDRQIQQIYQLMVDNDPRQLHFEAALWTRTTVQDLIQQELNVHLSEVSVGRLLAKMGLSPQRPVLRGGRNNQTLMLDWMTKDFPAIKKMAQKEQAAIYFGHETSIRSDYHSSKAAVSLGEASAITSIGSRSKVNLISAISTKGVLRFMATETMVKADFFHEFLHRLMDKAPHPVYLIIDRYSTPRSKKVRDFIASTEDKLKILYLPPRSPEFNPDELVWNYLKKQYSQAPNA